MTRRNEGGTFAAERHKECDRAVVVRAGKIICPACGQIIRSVADQSRIESHHNAILAELTQRPQRATKSQIAKDARLRSAPQRVIRTRTDEVTVEQLSRWAAIQQRIHEQPAGEPFIQDTLPL